MPPPQMPRVEELEYWSNGEKVMTREKYVTPLQDTITISAELYERLLHSSRSVAPLSPTPPPPATAAPHKFASAGPFGLFGLFITTLAFSCMELGMGGSNTTLGSNGVGGLLGSLVFTAPVPLLFTAFSEWLAGSFFAFVVYGVMGVFWLSIATVFYIPSGIAASYSPTGNVSEGFASEGFNSDFAIWLLAWGLAIFVILVCSLKTNITFIVLFAILDAGLFIYAAGHFNLGQSNVSVGLILIKVGAGCTFVVALLLFYLLCITMFDEMDVGIHLPIGALNVPPIDLAMQHLNEKHNIHHDEESHVYVRR